MRRTGIRISCYLTTRGSPCVFRSRLFIFGYGDAGSESQEQTVFGLLLILVLFLCLAALSRIEVDAVGYPDEHVAVCDPVVLGYAHADTVAS